MCVILAVDNDAPDITTDEFIAANQVNSDGFGAAWVDDKSGLVHYMKLVGKDIDEYTEWRPPKPYVFHFRIATVGAAVPELCHPFVVSKKSQLQVSGAAKKVLFHNGHWGDWNTWLGITFSGIGKLPSGAYSDSRTMALLLAHYGDDALSVSGATSGQRIVTLDKDRVLSILGSTPTKDDDGVYRSNHNHLWGKAYGYYGGYDDWETGFDKCKECSGYTTKINTSGKCNDCEYPKGIPTKQIENICSYCYRAVTGFDTLCEDCLEAAGEILCMNEGCDHRLACDESLATKYCADCRKKSAKLPLLKQNELEYWCDWYKLTVTKAESVWGKQNLIISPFSFNFEEKDGKPLIEIMWLDKKKKELVNARYEYHSNAMSGSNYYVTYTTTKYYDESTEEKK